MFLNFISSANNFLMGFLLIVILCGAGAYLTFKLNFIQVRHFKTGFNLLFAGIKPSKEKRKEGEMSPFQAISAAIAGQVGAGNLAGAATALISGGPGSIFWMWLSAFFGMATIYSEASLAQQYKTVDGDGEVTGGPVYYILAAFKGTTGKVLAGSFAVFITLALGLMGNMVQSNTIGSAIAGSFAKNDIMINPLYIGIIVAVLCAFVFFGGTEKLAQVVEKVVPVMAIVYILGSLILLLMNIKAVPTAFLMIFKGAFNPEAILGGGAGIMVRDAIRYGVGRGLFSNEAGMGSTPHAHARANAKNPHEQGLVAMVGVFVATFCIVTLTALAIICTGVLDTGITGIALSQEAYITSFGSFGGVFISVSIFFFAISTIVSWHFFGAINVKYLFGAKYGKSAVKGYTVIVLVFIVLGSYLKVDIVWALSDFFNSLMVIPNILGLIALTSVVIKNSKVDDLDNGIEIGNVEVNPTM